MADYTEFANSIGITEFTAIPISGFKGDNIAAHSDATSWYSGPTLMAHLEGVDLDQNTGAAQEFRMPVQWVTDPIWTSAGLAAKSPRAPSNRGMRCVSSPLVKPAMWIAL